MSQRSLKTKITKLRLLNRQIKNDAELEADIQIAAIERGDPQDNTRETVSTP